jgi:hypothetical protein
VIAFLSSNFVPAAINLNKVRGAKDADAEFYRSIYKQQPQYQGFWIVSPEGKVLAAHHKINSHKTWTQEVLNVLADGLRKFGAVQPRRFRRENPLPLRGRGVESDGRVTLALWIRPVLRGELQAVSVFDSITFSGEEFAAFSPP